MLAAPIAQPWPAALPEQVRAVAAVLGARNVPLDLAALGRARCEGVLWRGVQ